MKSSDEKHIEALMREKKFTEAIEFLEPLIAQEKPDSDALYFKCVCLRYLGEVTTALSLLQQLKMIAPGHSRGIQEEGHCYAKISESDKALQAYQRATQINPALIASWIGQLKILVAKGDVQTANQAKQQFEYIQKQPKAIQRVIDLMSSGRWIKAETLCRQFLQKNPKHVEAMRLLAEIGVQLGVLDDAEFLLESALSFDPNNFNVHKDYILVLRKRQQFQKALDQAKILLAKFPNHPQAQSLYAIELMQTGDYEQAIQLFDQVLTTLPKEPITLTSRGHALKTWGKTEQAVSSYRDAIDSKANHGEAWYSLANLKTVAFEQADIETMLEQLNQGDLNPADLVHLYFALGKAYEDEKNFEQSFHFYSLGNAQKKAQSRYSAEQMTEEFVQQKTVFTADFIQNHKGVGCDRPDPIFIVGLPRSGSTLLEQILASHSQVDGTLELPNILSLVHQLRRGEQRSGDNLYPKIIPELAAEKFRAFGEQFIAETQIHRKGAPFFIDKMPNNFRHIGLIKTILPNAKIIDARRYSLACCFSGFKQLFAEGQEFSYSLADIGRYYRDYVDLMDFWQAQYPGDILLVRYEDVVDDVENQVRRLLDYCGLPFEDACLNFYKNQRAVRTASSEQVRKPIYRSGLDQWQNYSEFLTPLKDALGPELV